MLSFRSRAFLKYTFAVAQKLHSDIHRSVRGKHGREDLIVFLHWEGANGSQLSLVTQENFTLFPISSPNLSLIILYIHQHSQLPQSANECSLYKIFMLTWRCIIGIRQNRIPSRILNLMRTARNNSHICFS